MTADLRADVEPVLRRLWCALRFRIDPRLPGRLWLAYQVPSTMAPALRSALAPLGIAVATFGLRDIGCGRPFRPKMVHASDLADVLAGRSR